MTILFFCFLHRVLCPPALPCFVTLQQASKDSFTGYTSGPGDTLSMRTILFVGQEKWPDEGGRERERDGVEGGEKGRPVMLICV